MKKLPRVLVKCSYCDSEFEVISTRASLAKYCSHKCYQAASIGRKAWNKGIKFHSEEELKKRSDSMKGNQNPMYGKKHTQEAKAKMSKQKQGYIPWNIGKKFPGLRAQENRSGENNAYVKHILKEENISYEEYLKRIDDKELYYRLVDSITNKQPIYLLEHFEKRGRTSYHLDHIYPISKGFENKIPPEIIGDISNLRFIPWLENIQKANRII